MAIRFRSKFEADLAGGPLRGVAYEPVRVPYTEPQTRHYCPDFILPNGIVIEAKGMFSPRDRAKTMRILVEHPDIDLRFVFQTPYKTLNPGSMTTYAAWAEKHGIPWCSGKDTWTIAAWKAEPVNQASLDAVQWRPK